MSLLMLFYRFLSLTPLAASKKPPRPQQNTAARSLNCLGKKYKSRCKRSADRTLAVTWPSLALRTHEDHEGLSCSQLGQGTSVGQERQKSLAKDAPISLISLISFFNGMAQHGEQTAMAFELTNERVLHAQPCQKGNPSAWHCHGLFSTTELKMIWLGFWLPGWQPPRSDDMPILEQLRRFQLGTCMGIPATRGPSGSFDQPTSFRAGDMSRAGTPIPSARPTLMFLKSGAVQTRGSAKLPFKLQATRSELPQFAAV